MNLLVRSKLSAHLISSSLSSCNRHCYLQSITAIQQCYLYSTRITSASQKGQQLTKPRSQKSSESSSSSFSQRIEKQTEAIATVWPKPREMPYQAKVANFVNLIGYVKIPVQFESGSDGKHFATTVICIGNEGERSCLLIPVVFEGDLAHVVACHVKEGDSVFVSGQLSVDPMRLALNESLGKFYILPENLNYVKGLAKSVLDRKMGVSVLDVETDKLGKNGAKNIEEKLDKADDDVYFNQLLGVVYDNTKENSSSIESSAKPLLKAEPTPPSATLEHGNVESLPEKGYNKSGESVSKKKDGDQILDLWRDLVKNPLQWWDYRNHKANGLVKEKFPDFKQKGTGESLWINGAPKWVLPGLGKLEFDVKDLKATQVQGGERPSGRNQNGKFDDPWKNLVENPDKWWDNRANKKNLKAPDFRHKETGEALWLDKSPVWALSRLPPMKGGQNTT